MEHPEQLRDLALAAAIGVAAVLVLGRLRLPAVAGLLASGAIAGPHGLGLVKRVDLVETLAEVGVVLLLFTIGLEFSLARLRYIAKHVVLGGSLQVGVTIVAAALVSRAFGHDLASGVFLGYVFALSSTAIVLRALSERDELDAPHGRLTVGALIFQDLCVVPMMLTIPVLAGVSGGNPVFGVLSALVKAAAVVVATVALARVVVPRLFARIAATGSRDVFVLAVLTTCIGTAGLTAAVGLSMALGAFLAGLVLAETDYGHRAMAEVLPLRDLFASMFFISLGMLFDVRLVLESPFKVGLLLAAFVVGKGFLATLAALVMRFPARVAWLAGVGLAQFGEFSFVLVRDGQKLGLLDGPTAQSILTAGILSMFLTPLAVRAAPHLAAGEKLLRPLERLLRARGMDEPAPEHQVLTGHVIIGGYGLSGRLLSRTLSELSLPHVVLELDADLARRGRDKNIPVYYGDVTSPEVLRHARAEHARALVLLINDREATQRAVAAARRASPDLRVFLRTRRLSDADALLALGARDVVSEELEAGMEVLARVLREIGTPRNVISDQINRARSETQVSQRRHTLPGLRFAKVPELADLRVETFLVRDGDAACGKSLAQIRLRTETGALVVAVGRAGELLVQQMVHEPFKPGDVVFLVGSGRSLRRALERLGPPGQGGGTEAHETD